MVDADSAKIHYFGLIFVTSSGSAFTHSPQVSKMVRLVSSLSSAPSNSMNINVSFPIFTNTTTPQIDPCVLLQHNMVVTATAQAQASLMQPLQLQETNIGSGGSGSNVLHVIVMTMGVYSGVVVPRLRSSKIECRW